jgi:hypothetical protein
MADTSGADRHSIHLSAASRPTGIGFMSLEGKVPQYVRAGAIAEARTLTSTCARGFGAAACLWVIAAFVDTPVRYQLGTAALIVEVRQSISRPKTPDSSAALWSLCSRLR